MVEMYEELVEKFLNRFVVCWFEDGDKSRCAKGVLTSFNKDFLLLESREYGSILVNMKRVIKLSSPKRVDGNGGKPNKTENQT